MVLFKLSGTNQFDLIERPIEQLFNAHPVTSKKAALMPRGVQYLHLFINLFDSFKTEEHNSSLTIHRLQCVHCAG